MKRALIAFTVIPVLLAGTALVAPGFVDWNKYKAPIIAQIETATGYQVTIGGDLDMAVLPFPRVHINDLGIGVPGESEPLVTLRTAAVNVALLPLLGKKLQINSVELKNPDVRLIVDEQGQPVWMTPVLREQIEAGRSTPAKKDDDGQLALSIDSVRITGGTFTFVDRRTDKPVKLSEIDMNISVGSLAGPFSLNGGARYAQAAMKIEMKSARLDAAAGHAPVNATLSFPESGGVLSFAGVAGLKDGQLELQGETGLKANNLAQLVQSLTDQPNPDKSNPALAKAIDVQGVMTFGGDALAMRNMKIGVAGQNMTGAVALSGLKEKQFKADINLGAAQPVDLKALLATTPVTGKTASAKTATAKAPLQSFIPATLNLPVPVDGTVDLKMAGLAYGEASLRNIAANLAKKDGRFDWELKAEGFGGTMTEKGGLSYKAASRSANGGVTYSDPQMTMGTRVENIDIEDTLSPFVSAAQLKPLTPVLADRLTGTFTGTITPDTITAKPARITVGRETLTYEMTYKLGARPLLTLGLAADSFDAGRWMQAPQQAGQQAVSTATPRNKAQIAELAKKFSLPLDVHLTLALKDVTMPGAKYDDVFFVGKVTGDRLEIDKAGLSDAAQNNVSVTGTVGSVNNLRDIDLTVGATTPDAYKMLSSFNVDVTKLPKNIGRAELSSAFKGQADNLSFVVNLKAMQGTMESSGGLTNLLATPQVNGLNVRLRHPSYVEVMRIFNPAFSSGVAMRKSLDLFASMNRNDKIYKFTDLQAQIGDIKASGTIDVNMAGVRPAVKGALQVGTLPLDELLGVKTGQKGTVRANTNVPATTPAGDVRWSRNAINTAWLWKFDMDMTATAAAISYGEWKVEKADLALNLKDGALNVTRLNGDVGGGTMALTGGLKSSAKDRQPVTVNAGAKFTDVALEQIVRGFAGAQLVKARGGVSMDVNVNSTGISPAALIFDLKGGGKAQGKDILIEGFDLARLSRTLAAPSSSGSENIGNIVNATMAGGMTQFDTFYTDIAISEGVVTFPKFKLDGKDAALMLDGNVNLPLWMVDLTSRIKLAEPADAPELRLSFKGPLDNPGQTFGRNALDSYIQQVVGSKVQDLIQNKLDNVMDGKLNQLLGGGSTRTPAVQIRTPAAEAPAAAPKPTTSAPVTEHPVTQAPVTQTPVTAAPAISAPATIPAEATATLPAAPTPPQPGAGIPATPLADPVPTAESAPVESIPVESIPVESTPVESAVPPAQEPPPAPATPTASRDGQGAEPPVTDIPATE